MAKLLIIDSESGGLDPSQHSILSLAGVVWEDGTIREEKEVFILEDVLCVTPKAMEVNRIDLVAHATRAQDPHDSLVDFVEFLEPHFEISAEFKASEKIVLCGHNISFDIGMLRRLFLLADIILFEDLFSHRSLDTMSILRYLHLAGKVPASALSSTGGFEHFNIVVPEADRHTALGDARATAELLNRTLELIKT